MERWAKKHTKFVMKFYVYPEMENPKFICDPDEKLRYITKNTVFYQTKLNNNLYKFKLNTKPGGGIKIRLYAI